VFFPQLHYTIAVRVGWLFDSTVFFGSLSNYFFHGGRAVGQILKLKKENIPKALIPSKEVICPVPKIIGEQVWCPPYNDYALFIKIPNAAKLASVNRRSIYRYIEEGVVYTVKVAGKSYPCMQ